MPGDNRTGIDVDKYVDYNPHMEVVQIVLEKDLLQAADRAARHTRTNRSALVRDALREHLRRLEIRRKEELDRRGYLKTAQSRDESLAWEAEAAWPPE
jgi:metal-responsive CopG/Arc/MetJ family transcriptional regulator